MVLFVVRKLILQTRMRSHTVRLDVWFLVRPFDYFHTACVRTAKALARLRGCAGSPEPWLVACVISTIISWADSVNMRGTLQYLSWYVTDSSRKNSFENSATLKITVNIIEMILYYGRVIYYQVGAGYILTDTVNNMKYSNKTKKKKKAVKIRKCIHVYSHSCKQKMAFYLFVVRFR